MQCVDCQVLYCASNLTNRILFLFVNSHVFVISIDNYFNIELDRSVNIIYNNSISRTRLGILKTEHNDCYSNSVVDNLKIGVPQGTEIEKPNDWKGNASISNSVSKATSKQKILSILRKLQKYCLWWWNTKDKLIYE